MTCRATYFSYRKHGWTDEAGRARLRGIRSDRTHVLVGAEGFEFRDVPLDQGRGSTEDPVVVTLRPANRLEITLEPQGLELDGLEVVVVSDEPLLEVERAGVDENGHLEDVERRFLEILGTGIDTPTSHAHVFEAGEPVWSLWGLQPDQALTLEVREPRGALLDRVSCTGPTVNGTRRITLPVSATRVALHGRILGDGDRPIAGAVVSMEWSDTGTQWLARTAADGSFEADVVRVSGRRALALRVSAKDFATRRVVLAGGVMDGDLGEHRLERDVPVELTVVQPDGRELAPDRVWARVAEGFDVHGSYLDGKQRLRGLPGGPLTVHVQVGGNVYSRALDFPESPLRIEVPAHGILEVDLLAVAPDYYPSEASWMRVLRPDTDLELRLREDQPVRRALLPGAYVLEHRAERTPFEIRAGETTVLDLGR